MIVKSCSDQFIIEEFESSGSSGAKTRKSRSKKGSGNDLSSSRIFLLSRRNGDLRKSSDTGCESLASSSGRRSIKSSLPFIIQRLSTTFPFLKIRNDSNKRKNCTNLSDPSHFTQVLVSSDLLSETDSSILCRIQYVCKDGFQTISRKTKQTFCPEDVTDDYWQVINDNVTIDNCQY